MSQNSWGVEALIPTSSLGFVDSTKTFIIVPTAASGAAQDLQWLQDRWVLQCSLCQLVPAQNGLSNDRPGSTWCWTVQRTSHQTKIVWHFMSAATIELINSYVSNMLWTNHWLGLSSLCEATTSTAWGRSAQYTTSKGSVVLKMIVSLLIVITNNAIEINNKAIDLLDRFWTREYLQFTWCHPKSEVQL